MLNQLIIAGRIASIKELINYENKTEMEITIAVPRSYKNVDGVYETDFITCIVKGEMARTTLDYCKSGDVVGVKGRIETHPTTNFDNSTSYKMEIAVEKISFLSSGKNN